MITQEKFAYFSIKSHVAGAHKNCLNEHLKHKFWNLCCLDSVTFVVILSKISSPLLQFSSTVSVIHE